MKIKSKDVAKALGLSEATVSLVLNQRPGVSADTRKKVMDYIRQKEEEAYRQNRVAEAEKKGLILLLQYKKHGIIFERASSKQDDFTGEFRRIVNEQGYDFEYAIYDERKEKLQKFLDRKKQENLKGIYLMGAEMDKHQIYYFHEVGVPIVVGDNNFYDQGIDSYLVDNWEGIKRCVEYLVTRGHSQIVYLAESVDIFNFVERREAFVHEMARMECGDAHNRIVRLGKTYEEIYEEMCRYLEEGRRRPTAFVLESELISVGVMQALQEHKIRIPRDISLVGFDKVPPVNMSGLQLTIVKGTHSRRHGAALRHLIQHIEDDETEIVKVYYRTRMWEGNSVHDKTKYIYK
ncbi:MAG: LacI family DNA-binding transcriptional regulator [Eubacteriales bacterium]|nr:LacI family DNA-binding transcriptional regulator [Eubacteriales bacterium]